jgi:hypothetical protein
MRTLNFLVLIYLILSELDPFLALSLFLHSFSSSSVFNSSPIVIEKNTFVKERRKLTFVIIISLLTTDQAHRLHHGMLIYHFGKFDFRFVIADTE